MKYYFITAIFIHTINLSKCQSCHIQCPTEDSNMTCGFEVHSKKYRMFPSKCAMESYTKCHKVDFVQTPLYYCIKNHLVASRKMYGESCPVFCPSHYRPVCGASKYKDYIYRTFNNGCYLDMLNCRGDDDFSGYVEVPLEHCQRHLMKNIWKERVVVSNMRGYLDYR